LSTWTPQRVLDAAVLLEWRPDGALDVQTFVGGANDTATGLTDLGAREYQPGTGSFISPDPLLNPYDPQDLNAYAYAADNPATNSDPSGAMAITNGGGGASSPAQVDCTGAGRQVAQCDQPEGRPARPPTRPAPETA
jgi:RHS repeat-associated protein